MSLNTASRRLVAVLGRAVSSALLVVAIVLAALGFAQVDANAQDYPSYPSYPSGPIFETDVPPYECPQDLGYTTNGLTGTPDKVCTLIIPAELDASGNYGCPSDVFVSSGSGAAKTCTFVVVFDDLLTNLPPTTYSCPAGYASAGSGAAKTCTRTIQVTESTANILNDDGTYSCPAGYNASGTGPSTICSRLVPATESTANIATPAAASFVCPEGFSSLVTGTVKYCARPLSAAEIAALGVTAPTPVPTAIVINAPAPAPTAAPVIVVPAPVVAPPAAPAPVVATVAVPVVRTAADFGFASSVPTTHAAATAKTATLAHTGSSSELLSYAGLALLAAGAVLLGTRRNERTLVAID